MGSEIHIDRYRAVLEVVVDDALVEQNVGYLPWVIGENLAGQVDAHVNEQRLGYYPALDYFREWPNAVDPALLELCTQLGQWVEAYARRELRRRLSRAFSSVTLEEARLAAFAMPRVLPSRDGAPAQLALHYSPNRLRLELRLGLLSKQGQDRFEPRVLLTERLHRCLGEAFASWQLLSAEAL